MMDKPLPVQSQITEGTKQVGNYLILKMVGAGSFGKVYKAKEIMTGNIFGLKVIPVEKIKSVYLSKMIETEATIMKKINHQNIMHLHEFMKSDKNFYMVLDFCEGGDLYKYIRKKEQKFIDEAEAIPIFMQIMNGFFELRKYNIIHRDIKTENIFLKEGRWIVGDFGLAKMDADNASSYVGSYEFMAPEMLKNGPKSTKNYSSKVDLWSIGCLFYEILFGDSPFHYRDSTQMLSDMVKKGGKNLNLSRKLSANATDLLQKLLDENPETRMDWNDFFKHPLFSSATPSQVKEVPEIGKIKDYEETQSKVINDFNKNKNENQNFTKQPQLDLTKITATENTKVIENVKIDEKVQLNDFLQELNLRYIHERNKLWWISYVTGKIANFLKEKQLRSLKDRLSGIVFLLSSKTVAYLDHLINSCNQNLNIFKCEEKLFQSYIASNFHKEFKASLEKDIKKILESNQKVKSLLAAFIKTFKDGQIVPSASTLQTIEKSIELEYGELKKQIVNLLEPLADIERTLTYILAIVRSCFFMDNYFRFYVSTDTSDKFDWVLFYNKIENGTSKELQAYIN